MGEAGVEIATLQPRPLMVWGFSGKIHIPLHSICGAPPECRALCTVGNDFFSGGTATQGRRLRNLSLCRSDAFYRQHNYPLLFPSPFPSSLLLSLFLRSRISQVPGFVHWVHYGSIFPCWPGALHSHLDLQESITTNWALKWFFPDVEWVTPCVYEEAAPPPWGDLPRRQESCAGCTWPQTEEPWGQPLLKATALSCFCVLLSRQHRPVRQQGLHKYSLDEQETKNIYEIKTTWSLCNRSQLS